MLIKLNICIPLSTNAANNVNFKLQIKGVELARVDKMKFLGTHFGPDINLG